MRNLLPSLSGGRRGDVGRENNASEMLPSELAVRMDMKTGDAEGPGEEEQGRSRERAPGSDKAPQAWEERCGQGQDLRVPSSCCESIGIQS